LQYKSTHVPLNYDIVFRVLYTVLALFVVYANKLKVNNV
jgi:hypothetical protein